MRESVEVWHVEFSAAGYHFSLEFLYRSIISFCYASIMHRKKRPKNQEGFALLVFVIVMAMSLLLMIVSYSASQKGIADNIREIVKSERNLQSGLLCVDYISSQLTKFPQLGTELISNIKKFEDKSLIDRNYWIKGSAFSNYKSLEGEYYNCKVLSFDNCVGGFGDYKSMGDVGCDYKSEIEGYFGAGNWGNNSTETSANLIYVEWKLDEYRFYISKLRVIRSI